MATWQMYLFQDSNSPFNDNFISFHNLTFMIMTVIITILIFILMDIIFNYFINRFLLKHHTIEILWTIIPILILFFICFQSLKILYYIDEVMNPYFTIEAIGHQWYWSYEYPEFNVNEFDSYMIMNSEINMFRLLDVDCRLVIPMKTMIRLITTSTDVIHSWTVPSLGIKIDSVPGRINQINLISYRPGVFYGQCSDICGCLWFMPITLESTSMFYFINWINMKQTSKNKSKIS